MQGELAALGAAFLWALATVIFGRLGKVLPPLVLNLTKGTIAVLLLGLTVLLLRLAPAGIDRTTLSLLLTSGFIGIGAGDTAYFASLNHLGPRRALLMESLAPPMAALIALAFLGETLTLWSWVGMVLTLLGVAWVISERVPQPSGGATDEIHYVGLGLGLLAAIGQAIGAVLSRAALASTEVDPLWSTLLRLMAGLILMVGILRWQGPLGPQMRPLKSRNILGGLVLGAFMGTYLALYLQQTALKYAETGIAQALTSTSPLFVLPIAALMGERISLRAIFGVVVALVGVGILVGAFG
jgi:drug/metabolite transporter (DMT)-like permease